MIKLIFMVLVTVLAIFAYALLFLVHLMNTADKKVSQDLIKEGFEEFHKYWKYR